MVELRKEGDVFILTMVEGQNRWNTTFVRAFSKALDEVEESTGPAALVTTSANEKFYSNGLDIEWYRSKGEHSGGDRAVFVKEFMALMSRIMTFPMPTVAAINGHAFGAGFIVGALAMIGGGLLSVLAIFNSHFGLFCAAGVLLGLAQSSALYYRLAATDGVPSAQQGSVLAWVFSGGVVAALVAPSIGLWSKDLFLPDEFAGAFMVVVLLGLATLLVLFFAEEMSHTIPPANLPTRSLLVFLRQRRFWLAITNAAIGNGVMVLVMVATPLAVLSCGFSVSDSASIIQWHMLGMFLPSFFSGRLMDTFGTKKIALLGAALLLLSCFIALANMQLINFYVALFLLGIGWNFLYLSGSAMIASCHKAEERGKVQGFAEFIIALASTLAALGSGLLLTALGWVAIHSIAIVLLLIAVVFNLLPFAVAPNDNSSA